MKDGEWCQILKSALPALMEDWLEEGECDLEIRNTTTPGMAEIKVTNRYGKESIQS